MLLKALTVTKLVFEIHSGATQTLVREMSHTQAALLLYISSACEFGSQGSE